MRLRTPAGPLRAAFLLLSPLLLRLAAASPAIDVGLRASWNSAPFLLELLETAAEENPASYFPLVSRIASGSFANSTSDRDLYDAFLRVAHTDGFLSAPEEVASFDLALSLHSAAPRIEAHYQYYTTALEPLMGTLYDDGKAVWLQWGSKQVGDAGSDLPALLEEKSRFPNDRRKLQFERVLETNEGAPAAILYADLQDPAFRRFHETLVQAAREGKVSYRLRYRPPPGSRPERPVMLSGYGIELTMKKTDYMVMDDRDVPEGDAKQKTGDKSQAPLGQLEDAETHDIKPLPQKEIATLGHKAATFVMQSEDPFGTLVKLLQDFPKHSSAVAAVEINEDLQQEMVKNFEMFTGLGMNILWINGLQITAPQINAFALLDHLRRERGHIKGLKELGMTAEEAIKLLSHETFAFAKQEAKSQRFDYRDEIEGGGVISWMNNIETDRKYEDWQQSVSVLMKRTYPGQLHPIRKNIYSLVLPIDFSSREDLFMISENLRNFIQRKIAIRFGLVPLNKTPEATAQAKIYYHLVDTYGLAAALTYTEGCVGAANTETTKPNQKVFDAVLKESQLRKERTAMTLDEVVQDESLQAKMDGAQKWADRLGAASDPPTLFFNGQPFAKDEDWMTSMQKMIQQDMVTAQRGVYEGTIEDETDFVELFLDGAAARRNTHIFPQDESAIKLVDITEIASHDLFKKLPAVATNTPDPAAETSIWIVGDFEEADGYELLTGAVGLQLENPGVSLVLINNPEVKERKPRLSALLYQLQQVGFFTEPARLQLLLDEIKPLRESGNLIEMPNVEALAGNFVPDAKLEGWQIPDIVAASKFWDEAKALLKSSGIKPGQRGIVVNGRVVGPIPREETFAPEDFKALLEYEHTKRIKLALEAASKLNLTEKITGGSLGLAKLTNQVTLALQPFGRASLNGIMDIPRVDVFDTMLTDANSAISVGSKADSVIHITASLDPASETAQKLVPILNALSSMPGVYLKIFLNPERALTELPIKRFYRHVLSPKPNFSDSGELIAPSAHFANIPDSVLLSLNIDMPPSWLVTPAECIHDLDNIKLDAMADRLRGEDITAQYELESILIEGHSRDVTSGGVAPRGAQLVLGTEKNPHVADTIIMANVGYFQFKANPGFWRIGLMPGRSEEIYSIDTIGNRGYPEDEDTPEVALVSWQGVTLFPKFSRNPGMETQDVLELAPEDAADLLTDPAGAAKKWWKKASSLVSGSRTAPAPTQHADINIFSVASGHLYERFLNIMMVSVMKHTSSSVKFWFIENFLSPSFKQFLPLLAAEYGFTYELVTYKWPHWLRAQREKQREIWGYKILFLDVLFPLDLDRVIFVDADQIVRTDLLELARLDLEGAPYGFTPMCDSRTEIEGFRFWKQGYWKTFLRGKPYHISALYVVDLARFRALAAGDRLRQQYHTLSADPGSLSNLDQDLPNHMQSVLPIHSLPQEWLWCETWCSDESLQAAKTIDLCNNPMTKEPKLDRARRQVPEWTVYDNEVAALARRRDEGAGAGHLASGVQERLAEEAAKESEAALAKQEADARAEMKRLTEKMRAERAAQEAEKKHDEL